MSAVQVRHALETLPAPILDSLVASSARMPAGGGFETFAATQDILADWVVTWEQCAGATTTAAGKAHVARLAPRAERAKSWLVQSVLPLAYRIADVSDGEFADDLVQELMTAVLSALPKFDSSKSAFHKFAAAKMRHARPAACETVFNRGGPHVPDSWRHMSRAVRKQMDSGLDLMEAAESVRSQLLGCPSDADYAERTSRHVRSGNLAALNNIVEVLKATETMCALDAPVYGSHDDGSRASLADFVAAPAGVHSLDDRIASLCGVDIAGGMGDALAARLGLNGQAATRKQAQVESGVPRSALVDAEQQVKARVSDPLAWFVWLEPTFDPFTLASPAGDDFHVVW